MSEEQTSTQTTPTTTEAPAANTPEARTETGELKNQAAAPPVEPTNDATNPTEPKPEAIVVPEKYEFKLPEGTELDTAAIESATPIFKELGLGQDQAQKLVELYNKVAGTSRATAESEYNTMREGWRSEVMADKDIGPKIDAIKISLGQMKSHLPADLRESFDTAMNFTGAGDHPAIVKAMIHFANMINEGTHVAGRGASPLGQNPSGTVQKPSTAQAMYPNLPSSNR